MCQQLPLDRIAYVSAITWEEDHLCYSNKSRIEWLMYQQQPWDRIIFVFPWKDINLCVKKTCDRIAYVSATAWKEDKLCVKSNIQRTKLVSKQ